MDSLNFVKVIPSFFGENHSGGTIFFILSWLTHTYVIVYVGGSSLQQAEAMRRVFVAKKSCHSRENGNLGKMSQGEGMGEILTRKLTTAGVQLPTSSSFPVRSG